jgi:squalene cyclase
VGLRALLAAGVLPAKGAAGAAVQWLLGQQNPDGGWGHGDAAAAQRPGSSDAVATARAMAALLAVGTAETIDAVEAAAGWLVRAQLADASWPESGDQPAGRSQARRRGSAWPGVAGVPLPLAALGQYVAAEAVHPRGDDPQEPPA